ncbi:hypothetical protein K438DRAFT_1746879 [Mycena galopus ATCC 62051]|nr:hypothetical protein K438DRAFT_1746879 [Mycena galopus ATCC 62051]
MPSRGGACGEIAGCGANSPPCAIPAVLLPPSTLDPEAGRTCMRYNLTHLQITGGLPESWDPQCAALRRSDGSDLTMVAQHGIAEKKDVADSFRKFKVHVARTKKTTELDSLTSRALDSRIPPSRPQSGIFRVPPASQIPKEGAKKIVQVLQETYEKGGQIEQKTTKVPVVQWLLSKKGARKAAVVANPIGGRRKSRGVLYRSRARVDDGGKKVTLVTPGHAFNMPWALPSAQAAHPSNILNLRSKFPKSASTPLGRQFFDQIKSDFGDLSEKLKSHVPYELNEIGQYLRAQKGTPHQLCVRNEPTFLEDISRIWVFIEILQTGWALEVGYYAPHKVQAGAGGAERNNY